MRDFHKVGVDVRSLAIWQVLLKSDIPRRVFRLTEVTALLPSELHCQSCWPLLRDWRPLLPEAESKEANLAGFD